MFSRYAFFLLAQLIWAAPTCSLAKSHPYPHHHRSSNLLSNTTEKTVAAAWYPAWRSSDFGLEDISWSKYTSVIYAFANTTSDVNVIGLQASDQELLPQFVKAAHDNNVNAILSIGGWAGSRYFSSAVATAASRMAFTHAIMKVVSNYSLDGIDFDWEYPNKQGVGCNLISANDSDNFLSFLQMLRSQKGAGSLIISAAVSIVPFAGQDGKPWKDVSGFAKVLNYIEIMDYDIWGSWSNSVGPNAPLNDSCAVPANQQGSAVSAVKAWTTAGFPINQIILAVGAYGHSFHVNQSSALDASGNIKLYAPFNKTQQPAGDEWDQAAVGVDVCGNPNVVGGVFTFWGLIDAGFLECDGTVSNGIQYAFDNCARTAYVYNSTSQVMVSFDDAASFSAKGQYIYDTGLAGFAMWSAGGDSDDILLDAIKSSADGPYY